MYRTRGACFKLKSRLNLRSELTQDKCYRPTSAPPRRPLAPGRDSPADAGQPFWNFPRRRPPGSQLLGTVPNQSSVAQRGFMPAPGPSDLGGNDGGRPKTFSAGPESFAASRNKWRLSANSSRQALNAMRRVQLGGWRQAVWAGAEALCPGAGGTGSTGGSNPFKLAREIERQQAVIAAQRQLCAGTERRGEFVQRPPETGRGKPGG